MSENRARFPIAVMCRVLGVSPSGYHAWVKRPASARAVMDDALIVEIRAAHTASKGHVGAPRLQIDLADIGIRVGRKRVARLMRHAGLAGVSRRKSTVTTVRDGARQAPDLVDRNFTANRPNMLWVADITYIPTWAGFLYLAVVLDAFSRRIVGWSMATTLHTQVVLDALDMALWQRRPSGVIHHSDQGRSILRSSSANDVGRRVFAPRWGRSETPTTMRWRRASLPRSNARSRSASLQDAGRGAHCRLRVYRGLLQSVSATLIARLSVAHQVRMPIRRDDLKPGAHSMPPCSHSSRSGLQASQQAAPPACRPSLTAARHDSPGNVQAGTKRCSRPNQKITPKRRTRMPSNSDLLT